MKRDLEFWLYRWAHLGKLIASHTLICAIFLYVYPHKSHIGETTEELLGQNITSQCWIHVLGPHILPKSGRELDWAHPCYCSGCCYLLWILPWDTYISQSTFSHMCICLFSLTPVAMWAHCWHIVGTYKYLLNVVTLFIMEQNSHSFSG